MGNTEEAMAVAAAQHGGCIEVARYLRGDNKQAD
jgi:hypothetical protein